MCIISCIINNVHNINNITKSSNNNDVHNNDSNNYDNNNSNNNDTTNDNTNDNSNDDDDNNNDDDDNNNNNCSAIGGPDGRWVAWTLASPSSLLFQCRGQRSTSEGGMIPLQTLIELKLLNSRFSSLSSY